MIDMMIYSNLAWYKIIWMILYLIERLIVVVV